MATRFANLLVRHEQGSTYRVEAKSGRVYTLESPHDLFISILGSEESGTKAKLWLEQCKRQGFSPRFVVGYRTLIDAKLSRGESTSNEVRGGVDMPISTLHGDITGMGDAKIGAGYNAVCRGLHRAQRALRDRHMEEGESRNARRLHKKSKGSLDNTYWIPYVHFVC